MTEAEAKAKTAKPMSATTNATFAIPKFEIPQFDMPNLESRRRFASSPKKERRKPRKTTRK